MPDIMLVSAHSPLLVTPANAGVQVSLGEFMYFPKIIPKMKLLIQNLATEYTDEGTGPVLLFLHGWQDNLHSFDGLAPYLKDDFRIVRLDLPGSGKTEFPKGSWDLDDYVSFVKKFTEKLDIKPYAVIGHSFGGLISLKIAGEGRRSPPSPWTTHPSKACCRCR